MPCRSDYDDIPRQSTLAGELDEVTALLCGLMRAVEKHDHAAFIKGYAENTKPLARWWKHHKAIDEAERLRKAAAQETARLKAAALAKLSLAERAALGLKD